MLRRFLISCVLLTVAAVAANSVFKTCAEVDFCNRLRYKHETSGYVIDTPTISLNKDSVTFALANTKSSKDLRFSINAIRNGIFRVRIDELEPSSRFRLDGVLDGVPQLSEFNYKDIKENIEVSVGNINITIHSSPFKIEFRKNQRLICILNGDDRLTVETEELNVAIALDILFPEAERAYGIPEHGDHLSLRTTLSNETDPYRLYNLDVPYHQLETTVALYGAVPVLYAHSVIRHQTTGIFWHNAAETWIEIDKNINNINTYFISESGIIDLFVLTGSSPKDAVVQYTSLTGTAPLPQYFTLGHHQSRWNYVSQEDVQTVVAEFDNHDLPLDVMWLDIEYTDNKKYFTWDPVTFPTPLKMLANLTATNRKLVTIIDPHIKKEVGYFVYDDALAQNFFVKNPNGSVFEGDCWPGLSSYIDFLNPEAQDFFANLYSFDIFNGSTENTYIWNDMNEPSVFDDLMEKTFPKNVVHHGNIKHRDVHNIYGLSQTKATFKGLVDRSENKKRPFILTRAHFSGTQRYSAIWTGDNTADWKYLAASISMCLSEALAGISFCGADVGGFFYDPPEDLLQRWYQLGAWLPFFRAHANIDTERREPYLFPRKVQERIRSALRQRYAHLPLWYTLFFQHEKSGEPVITPLFYAFPNDANVLDIDTQFLVGNVMVAPVLESNVTSLNIYFPGGSSKIWYDINNCSVHRGIGNQLVNIDLDKIPIYYGGGSIIFRKDVPRQSSVDTHDDPYTVYIFPNDKRYAEGYLYIDDTESYNYRQGEYIYIHVVADRGNVTSILKHANYTVKSKINRIIFAHPPEDIKIATITTQGEIRKTIPVRHDAYFLEANNLNLELSDPFILNWQ